MYQSIGILAQFLVKVEANPFEPHLVGLISDLSITIAYFSRLEVRPCTKLLSVWQRTPQASQNASEKTFSALNTLTRRSAPQKSSYSPIPVSRAFPAPRKQSMQYKAASMRTHSLN